MTDSLKVYDILKEAQIPDAQARGITCAIREFESALDRRLKDVATKADVGIAIAELKADLMRWMFIFWVGQMAATVGIVFAGLKLWR